MSRLFFLSLIVGGFFLAGCSTEFDPDEPLDQAGVKINEDAQSRGVYGYTPNPLTVITRTEITWMNMDAVPHRIVSSGGFFGSEELIQPNGTYSFIFRQIGNYRYYCSIPGHREEGTINVTP